MAIYLSLQEAVQLLPKSAGKFTHVSTLWRWCNTGLHGVKLNHVRMGARILVTTEDIETFGRELAAQGPKKYAPRKAKTAKGRTAADRDRAVKSARKTLAKK